MKRPYHDAESTPFDQSRADQYRTEIARAVPITEGDATFLYWTKHRGIPAEVVVSCPDLLMLPTPIAGREKVDFGAVSLLRPAPGADPTGVEIALVDRAGRPAATEPRRMQRALARVIHERRRLRFAGWG
jgi:hypothetical protein